ncbi:MAG: DUF2127 domain-containing protein [Isosphaeraceae bacterium]|nr:DUF2127 domain-containing protein [Isosphaeraceae bacterium]
MSRTQHPKTRNDLELDRPSDESLFGLRVVGAIKFTSGLLLAAAGFGIFRLLDGDLGATLEHYVSRLHLDPDNRLIHQALEHVGGLSHRQVRALGLGTLFYAALHLVEGTGLLFKRVWAGYLTVIASGSLLPIEIYEIAKKPTALRVSVLVVNVAIVVYLAIKIRHEHRRLRGKP